MVKESLASSKEVPDASGMTVGGSGMTVGGPGMTVGGSGMTVDVLNEQYYAKAVISAIHCQTALL